MDMNKEGTVKVVIQGREYLFDEDKVLYTDFFENEQISSISFKEPQLISFKIGDVENRDKQVSRIGFYKNGNLRFISFKKQPLIIFKIRNIYYRVKMEDLCFYKEGLIQYFVLAEDFKGSFSYNGEKYNLQFDNRGVPYSYFIKKSCNVYHTILSSGFPLPTLVKSFQKGLTTLYECAIVLIT